jgi:tight adherence protein B
VRALTTAWQLGGPSAAGMHAAAALLRERHSFRAEARAQSAQARTSARVLTAVPLAFALLGAVTSSSFRAVVTSPSGAAAWLAGTLLNLLGWQWMRVVVRRAAG